MKILLLIKKGWMKFARALGYVNTRVLLALFYILLGIPAIFLKLLRKDLLDRKISGRASYWIEKPPSQQTLEQSKHQF